MRNQALGAFMVLSLFLSLGAASGYGPHPLQASIPFEFFVGKTLLPAGEYTVEVAGNTRSVLLIRSADWRSSVFTLTHSINSERYRMKRNSYLTGMEIGIFCLRSCRAGAARVTSL